MGRSMVLVVIAVVAAAAVAGCAVPESLQDVKDESCSCVCHTRVFFEAQHVTGWGVNGCNVAPTLVSPIDPIVGWSIDRVEAKYGTPCFFHDTTADTQELDYCIEL